MQKASPIAIIDNNLHLTETSLLAAMLMMECDGVYWPDSCNEECFGAMRVGEWKERAKWNEIIYRRGGIVQGVDGEEGVSDVCKETINVQNRIDFQFLPPASALTGEM
jgi:hypothetical protein